MKKYALLLLAGLTLSACGSAPGQVTGNGRVSIGVNAADGDSTVTVTRTFTPATAGTPAVPAIPATPTTPAIPAIPAVPSTPESEVFSVGQAGSATFTFMTRPGSDAVYITGYRLTRYSFNGQLIAVSNDVGSLDIYVPSGYTCPERSSLEAYQSCQQFTTDLKPRADVQPANGLPISGLSLTFADALVSEVKRTLATATSSVDLEFFGESANGAPVVVKATGVQSRAIKAGN
ncbi:hypothetical protein [Deinococcus arenicola]|uniref:Lipoprotein n=1 Tax=Deinococcus arenicola TaxID=2994950 RepID=A0ABU4DN91_9DEIO|nr:hypothetical protein [Deinococcus sp. ZS9-10]MDV6373900.1 hypothetical protein [Deinococcus sp. ZS9-10]